MKLRGYQTEAAEVLRQALHNHGAALDASDTGTGKTPKALHVAKQSDCPIGIICPFNVVPTWRYWCREAGKDPLFILNYEKLRTGHTYFGSWQQSRGKYRLQGKYWTNEPQEVFEWCLPSKMLLIFDEVHYCKGIDSANGELLSGAKNGGHEILMLSATAAESPLDVKHTGYALDLHDGSYKEFYQFAVNHGATVRRGGRDLVFFGNQNGLDRLHRKIFPAKGHRVRIAELGGLFPQNTIIAEAYDLGDNVQELYEELEDALSRLATRSEEDEICNPLTLRLRARQATELLRVPLFIEKTRDALAQARSVVCFVNFRETAELLSAALSAPIIYGGIDTGQREAIRGSFQNNEVNVLICQIQCGGTGIDLHDLNGRPRTSLISPTDNARDLKQAIGRIWRDGALSPALQYVLFAANSIEEEVCANFNRKLHNMDLLNDGDLYGI